MEDSKENSAGDEEDLNSASDKDDLALEVTEEGESDEEDEEDDDMQQMLRTMQRVYEEVQSPIPRKDRSPVTCLSERPLSHGSVIVEEEWQESDSDSSGSLTNLGKGEGVEKSDNESVLLQLEETREQLEEVLGLQTMLQAYTIIQASCHDTGWSA